VHISKRATQGRVLFFGDNYGDSLVADNNYNNNWRFAGMTSVFTKNYPMKTYNNLWSELCFIENLEMAFKKAISIRSTYCFWFEKQN